MPKRRIKVAEFRGEDVELEFPGGAVYPIRGDLPMEVIDYIAEIEEDAQAAEGDDWFERGRKLLLELVREKTPDAVLPMVSPQEMMGIFGSIVGGETVGAAIAAALSDGLQSAIAAEAADQGALDGAAGGEQDGRAGPLAQSAPPPETPSSEPTSRSRSSTTGRRTGGAGSRGRSSRSSS